MKDSLQDIDLITHGQSALTEILQSIEKAQEKIFIRMYMWRDDDCGGMVLDKLVEALKKNADLKVIIEKDVFGSLVYNLQHLISLGRKGGDIFSSYRWHNIEPVYKNRLTLIMRGSRMPLSRKSDHSKIFVFDDDKALVGGMNIANDYLQKQSWKDYMLILTGVMVKYFVEALKAVAHVGNVRNMEVVMSSHHWRVKRRILKSLKRAKKSVWIEHGYITDNNILRQLRRLGRRGIEVNVIVPKKSDGAYNVNMHSIYKLIRSTAILHKSIKKLKVYLYPGMIHAKAIVIDNKTVLLGSANLTYGSFVIMRETLLIIDQEALAKKLQASMSEHIEQSELITQKNLPSYSRWRAWIEWYFI
jgi:cardiolipin synthase